VSRIASGVSEVNDNVNQTSAVAVDVTRDIAKVSQAAEEVNASSTELAKLAGKLNEMVKQFKI
jgi:methyl-accepting chemotaxis protein